MSRLYWLRGDRELDIRPALVLRTDARLYILRFGRDGFSLFSERYAGQFGIKKRYWYGPFGLTLIIRSNAYAEEAS